jgi:hypothetical protein
LSGDGSGNSSFATTTIIASLGSLVSATQKEEREKDKQKGAKRRKLQLRALKKKERGIPVPFQ